MGGAAQSGPTGRCGGGSGCARSNSHPSVHDGGRLALGAAEHNVDEVLARRHLNAPQTGVSRSDCIRARAQLRSGAKNALHCRQHCSTRLTTPSRRPSAPG